MKIVVYGLTITSSWGNGHATTYRSLLRALARRGHRIHFVEKDVEWYRSNRDLPNPGFCTVHLYECWNTSATALLALSKDADVVVIGSYFADAIAATRALLDAARRPILFYDIDTPITLKRLREQGGTEYLDAALIPHYDTYLSFTGGPALEELEQRFGSPRAVAFFCSVDPGLYHPTPERTRFRCDLSYLGTYAPDRQPKLEHLLDGTAALLPKARFLVAGPQYPKGTKWQPNVRRLIHISPPDHPAFYSSSRFTLNLTRDDMVAAGYSPSVRLFEASACGAAILTDRWAGIEEFLTPGEEVLLPADAHEVASILQHMPDAERKKMGRRAREHILGEHTADHRAAQFEQIISECHTSTSHSRAIPQATAGTNLAVQHSIPQS
jgi:spore maturation protein CgeB